MAKDKFKKPTGRMKKPPIVNEQNESDALAWVNEEIWQKVQRAIGHVPFITDLVAAYYCVVDTETPVPAKAR